MCIRDRVEAVAERIDPTMSEAEARVAIWRAGRQAVEDRLYRAWASGADVGAVQRRLALAAAWTPPKLPVGGKDLARLGLAPGPQTGRLLKAFEDGWIADDFPDHGHEARLKALMVRPG